jgi:hypothetical protein
MLTELCQEIRNWFERTITTGTITISNGEITFQDGTEPELLPGQYYRIVGSVFNDGVHQWDGENDLVDETFDGAVWAMAIPKEVIRLAEDIEEWREKYENPESPNFSPYQSESFGGYSYTKGSSADASPAIGWKSAFKSALTKWRKI